MNVVPCWFVGIADKTILLYALMVSCVDYVVVCVGVEVIVVMCMD